MGAEGNLSDMTRTDKVLMTVAIVLAAAIGTLWIVGSTYDLLPI